MPPDDQQTLIAFANHIWIIWAINVGVLAALNTPERLVLERIAAHVRKEHELASCAFCWPHLKTITQLTGLSLRAVERAIQTLKQKGILERRGYREPDGVYHARAICLHLEPAPEPATNGGLVAHSASREEPATNGGCKPPPAAGANRHQWRVPIENTTENRKLRTATRPPPAAPMGVGGRRETDNAQDKRARQRAAKQALQECRVAR
jgi:hypothetical protein